MATTQTSEQGTARTVALLGGDLVALLVFAAIGRRSHGVAAGLEALREVATTAAPFIGGWLVAGLLVGAYRRDTAGDLPGMLRVTALSWAAGLPLGALLRGLAIGRLSPPSFYLVTFLTVLALLGGWRAIFVWVEARRGH